MMKELFGINIFFIIVAALSVTPAAAQGRIEVSVSNFKTDNGVCRLCLFNSAENYEAKKQVALQCLSLNIKNRKTTGVFERVPAGRYAIFGFHDANNNNVMDRNFIGVPTEGYGASKNKLPFAAAPTYEDNQFDIDNRLTKHIRIKLRNL